MSYRFSSRRIKRIAARTGAADDSTPRERQLGMALLAVAPRRKRRSRDVVADFYAAVEKAAPLLGRRRRNLTAEERQARYEATLARVYRHRWSLRDKGE